ncbi:MAG: hypothetical protein K8S98_09210 [Planctomycetes bacterium]|nr:hypothetical protein [Planctomycetota bacterium]
MSERLAKFPKHGWFGLALVAIVWPLNWGLDGLRTHLLFAPLWVGYVLAVDGLCVSRNGSSILTRSPRLFAQLFLLSAPGWWLFELVNARLGNWEYLSREAFGDVEYFVLSTISFSTVMPAVFESAELFRGVAFVERFANGPRWRATNARLAVYAIVGLAMIVAMLAKPRVFYVFEWMSLVFLLEPLAHVLGRRSFSRDLERGDWRTWMSLWLGGLLCGFFWELWNFRSDPKWIYHTPGVEFWKLFEMPALGYLGYLPFAMELWLFAQLCLPRARELRI